MGSAGQRWNLYSEANKSYVAVEVADSGSHAGMLRARSQTVGDWEKVTLHTSDKGKTVTLRSEVNGLYVAAEINDSGADQGMLRARSSSVGSWEQFSLVPAGSGLYALRSEANGLYVSAEVNYPDNTQGMLRARSSSYGGSWEKFRLIPVPGPGGPPGASAAGADTVKVMSWNVCSNNSACPLYKARASAISSKIAYWATNNFSPDALFLQELCEKDAKPVETALEAATGRGWDVRFAPVQYLVTGTVEKAQKICVRDLDGRDRGSYGIGLAIPDSNVWYMAYSLWSPSAYEQRTVLCGTLESRALSFCATHFSSGLTEDDPNGTYRLTQVHQLLDTANKPRYRAIFGGDLNLTPPDSPAGPVPDALAPAYDAYEECDQYANGGRRTGTPTHGSSKLDYIFGPRAATYQCRVATASSDSDHKPIYATITLPTA